jgi:hypothetical protein
MKKCIFKIFFAIFFVASATLAQPLHHTLALKNGKIWTGDPARPWVSAVAITGNQVMATGTDKQLAGEIERASIRGAKVIDLKGQFAMPGFNDSHIHFLSSSLGQFEVDLTGARTLEEAQKRIKKFAEENPNVPWITGGGWQYDIFPGSALPKAEWIDAVVKDRPVFIDAYDGHTAWANTKAMEIAGVNEKTEFKGFGELVRDANGKPTGTFKEGAQGLIGQFVPRPTREHQINALKKGMERAKSLGITSIQNASGNLEQAELYDELQKKGELTLRTYFAFSAGPKTTQADIDKIAAAAKRFSSSMLRVGAVKLMVDGVIESHTAAMLAPYSNKPDTAGAPNFTQTELNNVVAMADKARLQVYIHAIGDRGVRMALDSFENAIRVNGRRGSRFRIEHIETIQAADMKRFAKLGVIASMEPIHADPGTVSVWSAAIGEERASRAFAWRALEKAGAKLIFSSDHPASISLDPIRGLHNAINRQTIEGTPAGGWLPEYRVSVETALKAYTVNGAYASFEEGTKGSIAPGMLADLIVLDKNPFEIEKKDLYSVKVMKTIFDGKVRYDHALDHSGK